MKQPCTILLTTLICEGGPSERQTSSEFIRPYRPRWSLSLTYPGLVISAIGCN